MNVISRIASSQLVADGPGRGMRGGGRAGFPIMGIVCLVVVAALVALAVVALRRSGAGAGGSVDRRRREFEDWHRAAHAGPVPTLPSSPYPTAPLPVVDAPVAPPANAAPVAPAAPAVPPTDATAPAGDATPPATTD